MKRARPQAAPFLRFAIRRSKVWESLILKTLRKNTMIEVPVSWGELVDKITILQIKSDRMRDEAKLQNVRKELTLLTARLGANAENAEVSRLTKALYDVNAALWDIEDDIRDCENAGDFGEKFVALARSVYITNDKRAELKREVNLALGSGLVEEKSYQAYKIQ
jgi:hypothetical protein